MSALIFDIETGPLPPDVLRARTPDFRAPANWKDPAKIAEEVERQRLAWESKAALDPTTGRVVAVGVREADEFGETTIYHSADEREVLREFWGRVAVDFDKRWVGFNSNSFDWPFLIRRAWMLDVRCPFWLVVDEKRVRWKANCVDLREHWTFGDRYAENSSLGAVAAALGVGEKTGSGKDFARLYFGTDQEREQALDYLRADLELTFAVYRRTIGRPPDTKLDEPGRGC